MKNIALSSVTVALLLLSGCSSTEPTVDQKAEKKKEKPAPVAEEVKPVATETIATDNSMVNSSSNNSENTNNTTNMSMSDIEAKLSSVHFAFDKYNITPQMEAKIEADAKIAQSDASKFNMKLEGNCDEWGSDEYNFALGLKRAQSVKKAMVAEGIDAKRISMVSYGESNPLCTDKTKECWAKNRRVDFKLLP